MKEPRKIKDCPFCNGGKVEIKTVKQNGIDWLVYECQDCHEQFTTTESDDISLSNAQPNP